MIDEAARARWVRVRMGLLCGVLALGLGLVVQSAYSIMVEDGSGWREIAESQRQRRLHVAPKRGAIYDRNGDALAVSVEVPSASLDAVELLRGVVPQKVPLVARDAANRLGAVLSLDPAPIERKILAKRRFAWLKRQLTAAEADGVRKLATGEDGQAPLRGVLVEGEGRRYYPRRELAGSLLGFVAPDGEGKDGLEYSLNEELAGRVEELRGLRDRSGRLLFSEGAQDERALAGHSVTLSLEQGLQHVAEHELAAAVRTFEAAGGSVVAIDPATGEILALASFPSFNPNDYSASVPEARRLHPTADVFEPGSTTKIFTVSAALAAGTIKPTDKLYCEKGSMPVDNVIIHDTHPSEWLTIAQVLAVSSNICAAKMGLGLGGDRLYEAFRRFGFGEETGLGVPGEASGTLRPKGRPWVPVETASAAFGHGIGVTNIQLAMAAAAVANGGELMDPILVKKIVTANGELVREVAPHVRRRVIPEHVARSVAELLVAVTEGEGTGVEAAINGYRVAGKTATAQKAEPGSSRYSLDRFVASFVGFVPAEKPVIAIAVTIDEPMVEHAGGAVAAPVFRRVAQAALELRGLVPRGKERADVAVLARSPDPANAAMEAIRRAQGKRPAIQEGIAANGPVPAGKVRVPDMTGWPAREAMKRALELGVSPRFSGSGLLVSENPPPGAVMEKGQDLLLVFEPAS